MQSSQYLILAQEIKKSDQGIFSYINVCQHLAVNELPAKGRFDLAVLCGPGWERGKYRIHIATKLEDNETPNKIGYADVEIFDESHIYTAVVKGLGLIVDSDKTFSFQVYKQSENIEDTDESKNAIFGDLILERPFRVKVVGGQQQDQQPATAQQIQ